MAESRARCDADPPSRLMGIWPRARKIHAVFFFSKYSALATKVIRRLSTRGRKTESENDKWLLARMAGPSVGTCSGSFGLTLNSTRRSGVRMALRTQYVTDRRLLTP